MLPALSDKHRTPETEKNKIFLLMSSIRGSVEHDIKAQKKKKKRRKSNICDYTFSLFRLNLSSICHSRPAGYLGQIINPQVSSVSVGMSRLWSCVALTHFDPSNGEQTSQGRWMEGKTTDTCRRSGEWHESWLMLILLRFSPHSAHPWIYFGSDFFLLFFFFPQRGTSFCSGAEMASLTPSL